MHIRTLTKAPGPVAAADLSSTLDSIVQVLTIMTTTLAAISSIAGLITKD